MGSRRARLLRGASDSFTSPAPAVAEHPILFSAPMIRALLEGRKTQTRRLVRFKPPFSDSSDWGAVYRWGNGWIFWDKPLGTEKQARDFMERAYGPSERFKNGVRCPYGAPGDRLWCKETFAPLNIDGDKLVAYRATCHEDSFDFVRRDDDDIESIHVERWKPAIFMPRAFSRLLLEVTEVRVQRLQEISESDAEAEGVERETYQAAVYPGTGAYAATLPCSWRDSFARLWDEINGKRAPWASNPWVWAVSFKRVEGTL